MLEDLGFYCIDNIPAALLKPFVSYTVRRPATTHERTAFGLRRGLPGDSDFAFVARALPNPFWEPGLRNLTGRDPEVIRFLETDTPVATLVADIARLVRGRVPEYQASNRGYLTVAVGCTGGQHRSVYIVDRLAEEFAGEFRNVTARHSGLPGAKLFQPPPRAASGAQVAQDAATE